MKREIERMSDEELSRLHGKLLYLADLGSGPDPCRTWSEEEESFLQQVTKEAETRSEAELGEG